MSKRMWGCWVKRPIRYDLAVSVGVAFLLASLSVLAGRPAMASGPFGGNISQAEELGYGRQADADIQKLYLVSHNARDVAWVNRVGQQLLPFSDRPDIPCTFRVLDDSTVNAFSVPGYIYIDTGLLNLIRKDRNSDDELAGVIAQELGHIGGRHIAHEIDDQQGGGMLGELAGMFTHKKFDIQADLGPDLYLLGHSQADECDADRRAVDTLMRAGVDPAGLLSFLAKTQAASATDPDCLPYFQTHPLYSDRVPLIKQEIADNRAHGVPPADSPDQAS